MSGPQDLAWEEVLAYLGSRHRPLVRSWFNTLQPAEISLGVLEVRAPNAAQQLYLSESCSRAFAEAVCTVSGQLLSVRFTTPNGALTTEARPEVEPPRFTSDLAWPSLNHEYTFENFVTGPCNRLGHAVCTAVSDLPGKAYNPLFIHGDVGLGKTHLLQAVCHVLLDRAEPLRTLYLSCETFTNHYLEAAEHGTLNGFRHRYRHVDALVIDDMQFLAERERSQEEFFHTFNTLYQSEKQIILSADCSPREIPSLEERLVSRFNAGLVVRLDRPCFETRLAIVRKKAQIRRVDVPDDVGEFIAARFGSNIRELEGALTRVLAFSLHHGRPLDLETAVQALADEAEVPTSKISMHDILEAVTKHFNIRLADLQGKRRNRSITLPRHVCMHLGRELTDLSLDEIGGYLGGRDHSTVVHGLQAIQDARTADPAVARSITLLTEELAARRIGRRN